MEKWRLLDTGNSSGAMNMAIDEAILIACQKGIVPPTLRFYGWNKPTVSLGLFQNADESINIKECSRQSIEVVRRMTGGRAVLHEKELTYSITSKTDNLLFPSDIKGRYRVIAEAILGGLLRVGINGKFSTISGKKLPKSPLCFSSPSSYEILIDGKKLVGSAQRVLTDTFLQHGSILLDFDKERHLSIFRYPSPDVINGITSLKILGHQIALEKLKEGLIKGFEERLGIKLIPSNLITFEASMVETLSKDKYSHLDWNLSVGRQS